VPFFVYNTFYQSYFITFVLLNKSMNILSNRVTSMVESATLQMARMARELKNSGVDVINLSLGEPDFDTPQHIKDAVYKAIESGQTKYTPVAGLLELKQAICRKFKRDNNLEFVPEQIVISTGAKQSIANACLALLDKEDEVLLPAPYWVSYAAITQLAEGKWIEILAGVEQDFKVTAQQLEEKITDKTKLIIFSSPCNPTGAVWHHDELKSIADMLAKYPRIHVISDEIYEYINYSSKHESLAQFETIKDRVITVNGFSKGFAMTGWRLGYMAATKEIAMACDKIQGQFTSGTCSFTQVAAITALDGDMSPTMEMKAAFLNRKKIVMKHISEISEWKCNNPDGAFYAFPNVTGSFGKSYNGKTIENGTDLALFLLKIAHVACVGGDSFGDGRCLRFSYAASEDSLNKAFDRIKEALKLLK
jgi:aspartate aminotransferase